MFIAGHVVINNNTVMRNNVALPALPGGELWTPETLYTTLQCNYPKFYKMDKLCKWAIVSAHYLLPADDMPAMPDKNKVGIILTTAHGCIEVDKRYQATMDMPSPALFVYTLPNIMLGEICIRYGFKGEQQCMVSHAFDAEELYFTTHSIIMNQGMQACLTGWVDVADDQHDINLCWITKNGPGIPFTAATLQQLRDASASK